MTLLLQVRQHAATRESFREGSKRLQHLKFDALIAMDL
jgi:hypothetical protein